MKKNVSVGIVGNGFVGNAVYQNLRDKARCKVYDVDKNRSLSSLEEVIQQDFIFVCLPTPMRIDGSCDLSVLDKFFEEYFVLTVGRFCLDNAIVVGVFLLSKAISQASAVSIVSAGLNTCMLGVALKIARCSTG